MTPVADVSYWLESTEPTRYGKLAQDETADVVVVGAGIAGVCTAWELARAGHDVVLLDAGRIVESVTGHTTAKLTALHTLIYADLRSAYGPDAARLYAQSQQDAVERVAQVSAELGIDCELERVPAFTYHESPDRLEDLAAEVEAALEAGLPASYVSESDLPYRIAGAVRVEDQAQFHPRKYLLGLAADLVARGGRIYEYSRAVELDEGEPCRVTTESGRTVTARDVVVATHYPVFDRAGLFARLEVKRDLVVGAVLPADDDVRGVYISPEGGTRSVRTAPYGDGRRLLVVTGESFAPGAEDDVAGRWATLEDWTRERFPRAELAYRWATQDTTSTDSLPFVGPFHPGATHVHVATGFGGWGMTNGVMTGRLLAASIAGEELPWRDLYDPRRLHPRQEAPTMAKLQAKVAKHFVGDRIGTDLDDLAELAPGCGAIMKLDGDRCAVFRDDDGSVTAVSARCTHLGCIVGFNDAERAWECPCHGSRFAVDGTVLQGPANRPLARRHVEG